MGFPPTLSLTAIGDTVNTASRLESATKEENCQLLVSEAVAHGGRAAGRYRTALRDQRCAAANRCWWRSRSTMRLRFRHRHERAKHDAPPFARTDPAADGSRLSARRAGQCLLVDRAASDPAGDTNSSCSLATAVMLINAVRGREGHLRNRRAGQRGQPAGQARRCGLARGGGAGRQRAQPDRVRRRVWNVRSLACECGGTWRVDHRAGDGCRRG